MPQIGTVTGLLLVTAVFALLGIGLWTVVGWIL